MRKGVRDAYERALLDMVKDPAPSMRQQATEQAKQAASASPAEAQTPPTGDMSDPKVAGRIQDRVDQLLDNLHASKTGK